LEKAREGQPFYMPKKLTKAQGKEMLENTKRRQRLLQEARTSARLEELDIEICEKLGKQLYLEHLELNGELDLSEDITARQYTRYISDSEEDLAEEQGSSSVSKSAVEIPD
jgi:hypothetical protein